MTSASEIDLGTNANESFDVGLTFVKYARVVLPLDGFVFWVKADLLSPSALFNSALMNEVTPNEAVKIAASAKTVQVKGSLHYATTIEQGEVETYAVNDVTFTSESEIIELNSVGPTVLYMSEFRGTRFAFSATNNFYQQAGIWHYRGRALYPDMETQVVDDPRQLVRGLIVSNSLPIWLSMNSYAVADWEPIQKPQFPLYPSHLVPLNLSPPFGAVHVLPESTTAIAGAPTFNKVMARRQLVKETIRVTTYGVPNGEAQDFVDFVGQYTLNNPSVMGIMNQPVVRDEKRGQPELQTIAQRKGVDFEVNYYQHHARNIARQLILEAIPTFLPRDFSDVPVSIEA